MTTRVDLNLSFNEDSGEVLVRESERPEGLPKRIAPAFRIGWIEKADEDEAGEYVAYHGGTYPSLREASIRAVWTKHDSIRAALAHIADHYYDNV